ncbi:42962_t:CDS:1, partial [Gigaspora margarita]
NSVLAILQTQSLVTILAIDLLSLRRATSCPTGYNARSHNTRYTIARIELFSEIILLIALRIRFRRAANCLAGYNANLAKQGIQQQELGYILEP